MSNRLLLLLAMVGVASAQTEYATDPLGFNTVPCLTNSDTIVGVPFRPSGSFQASLSAVPTINGDNVTLPIAGNPGFAAGAYGGVTDAASVYHPKYYVKFLSGTKDGNFYSITANSADSLTIDSNGDDLSTVAANESLLVAQYWTLDTLFPPAQATTSWTETPAGSGNWVQNGHAIVASTNTLGTGRRTEVVLLNLDAVGINLAPEGRYYIHNSIWKKNNSGNTNYGHMVLYPDAHFRISHPSTVTRATTFKASGEVHTHLMNVPLSTNVYVAGAISYQDNYIGVPRPLNLTLEQLGLRNTSAFMASTNTLGTGRRDELLVYDNGVPLKNRTPSARYYVHNNIWKLHNGGNDDRGTVVIPAGAGVIIRKYPTVGGLTNFWANSPTY